MVRRVRRDSRIASAAARRSPRTSVRSLGLDGDVGAGAHRDAEVGLGQRGGVVDAVADHRDDPALAPAAAATTSTLSAGSTSAITSSMPTSAGDRPRGGRVVAGEQHRAQAERAQLARPPRALVGLTVSATTSTPRARAVPADQRPRSARRLGVRAGVGEVVGSGTPCRRAARPPDDDVVAVDDAAARRARRGWRTPSTGGQVADAPRPPAAIARAIGCSEASSTRAGEPQHLVGVVARRRRRRRPASSGRW